MPDLPPPPPSVLSIPSTPQPWPSSPAWVRDLNGEPVFQTVGRRSLLVAIRWADDCAPAGFVRLRPGVFFPDDSAEGQRWKARMAWTRPDPVQKLAIRP